MFSGKRKLKGKTNMDNTANLSEFKSEIEEPASLTWDSEQKDNACAKIKQKSSVRKQYKQLKSKIINKYLTQKGKKQNLTFQLPSSVENTHGKNVLLDGKEKTVAAAMFESDARKSCKEHVIDEDETDNESVQNIHSPRTRCSGENICGQTPYVCQLQKNDHNFLQGSSSLFSNDSFAPSLNNEISQDSEERYFYAKDQQDLRLLQILRYIKDTEGGIDLLYNFFKEYKELLDRNEDKIDTVVPQSSRERDVYCTYGESDGKFFKGNSDNFRLLCYSQKEDEYRYSKEPIDHDDYQMQLRYNIYDSKEDTDESSDELEEKINFHIDEHNTNKVESLNFVNDAPTEEESKSNSNSDDIQDEKKSNPYRKYKHNTIEREDNYSCDNEESSFSEMTSEESQNKDHIQQSAYSSDELSDVIQASALPYVGFSSNSSSSSFICKSKVANEVSIGIQVNLGDLNTQTSKKLFYIKTRSHKKRRTRVISYAQLTRRKNQKIRSCKTQNPGIHLKSTATNLDDGENYTYQHHSQNDNSLKEFHIKGKEENNYFNITGNTDESNDKINNTQTELFDNSGIHLSKESTNTVQETKSDMFASKTNSEVIPDSLSVLNDQLERKIDESKSIYEHSEHHLLKPVLNHSLIEASKECSVWNLLEKLESPFKWAPDIMILAGVDHELQENIIEHLTGKEKEFLNAETNLFREIVVRIVISYEKILDSRLTDALSDLQYCFELLEEPLISSESDEEIIEFNYSNAHEYYFSKIQQRRQNFYKYKKEFEELNLSNKRNENNLKYQTFMSRFSNTCITKASKQEFQSNSKEIIDNGCTLIPVLSDNSIEEKNEVQIFTNVIDDSHKTISRTCNDPKFANRLLGLKDITQFCCETGSAVEDNVVVKDKFKEITQTEYPLFTEAQNKMNLTENVSICNSENEHCSDENSNETHIFENNVTLEERKGTGIQNKIVPETYSKENKTSENETNIPTVETIDTNVIHKRNSNNLIDSYTNSTEILVNYNTILENIAISDAACDNAVVDDVNAEHSKSSKDCEDSMSQEEFYPLKTKIDTSFLKCVNNDDRNLVENLPESKDSILLRGKSAENLLKNSEQLDSTNTGNKDLEPEELRKLALECVIYSVLSHVAYFTGSYEEAYKIAKQLQSTYERLGNIGTATLFAVQGSMLLEYSFSGNKLGLEFLKKAQQLDPEYWEWNLLCGKVMGRIRRVEGANGRKPTQEELTYLEKAVALNQEDAAAMVHLANVYRSVAHFVYKEKLDAQSNKSHSIIESRPYVQRRGRTGWLVSWRPTMQEELNPLDRWRNPQDILLPRATIPLLSEQKDYLQLAKNLYLKALEAEPNCPYNNARCAKGLWSMPQPYKDKERAESAIFKAIFLAPEDSLVNHYAGLFYEFCRDYEKALQSYEIAICENSNYPAELNYINLKLRTSRPGSYNPLQHFERLLVKYPNRNLVLQTLCHKGFYYFKVEGLFSLAMCSIAKAIKTNPKSEILKNFYPGSFYGQFPPSYNVFDLLEDIAAKYKELPETFGNDAFVKLTVEEALSLRPEVCDKPKNKLSVN